MAAEPGVFRGEALRHGRVPEDLPASAGSRSGRGASGATQRLFNLIHSGNFLSRRVAGSVLWH